MLYFLGGTQGHLKLIGEAKTVYKTASAQNEMLGLTSAKRITIFLELVFPYLYAFNDSLNTFFHYSTIITR